MWMTGNSLPLRGLWHMGTDFRLAVIGSRFFLRPVKLAREWT